MHLSWTTRSINYTRHSVRVQPPSERTNPNLLKFNQLFCGPMAADWWTHITGVYWRELLVIQESCAIADVRAMRLGIFNRFAQSDIYAHGSLLESPFLPVPSSTDCWEKQGKNGRLGGRRGETGSRNMAATHKIERALVTSYRPSIVTFPVS